MRILLLIKRFNLGGAETHLLDLANYLAGKGHQVWLLSHAGKQVSRLDKRVAFIPIHFFDLLAIFQGLFIARLVKKHNIQIIHAHQRLPILVACYAGLLSKIPVIATVHGKTRLDLRRKWTHSRLAKIIYVSQLVREYAKAYKEISSKAVYIPNGVILKPAVSDNEKTGIYYISRMDKRHSGLILMLINRVVPPLAALYPTLSLEIIGDGIEFEKVRRAAAEVNRRLQREVIVLHGFQAETDCRLKNAALVLGVGRVALEALALGIPVLSLNSLHQGPILDRSNYEELSRNNFVSAGSPPPEAPSLLSLLTEFFLERTGYEEETLFLHNRIIEDFSMDTIGRRTEELYSEVVAQTV